MCLSNYFQAFGTGLFFSYRLEDLAKYYRGYARLMDHWRQLPAIEFYEVIYEDLVQAQERVSRELIEHCGLPWRDTCLVFHQNPRSVHTASHWQVRQPVYRHSAGRWRNYEKYLPASVLALV